MHNQLVVYSSLGSNIVSNEIPQICNQ